jgi:hypothetical protein
MNEITCTKLQLPPEPLSRGLLPPDARSLCPLSSTEYVDPPPLLGKPLSRIEAGILKTAFYYKCWTKCFHSKSFDR